MSIFNALILGIVEGITEFLPISSTAHLILTARLLYIPTSSFLKTFEIAIQLGAIAAVAILYWKTFLYRWDINKKIIAAFLPTAILGYFLYSVFKSLLEGYAVVLWALLLGGIFLILFEWKHREKESNIDEISKISFKQAILIGIFQAVSIIPGVSRAAATIIAGMFLGLKRKTAVEFSFLLALPTMVAATGYDLFKNAGEFSQDQFAVLGTGFIISAVTALLAISFLLRFVKKHDFKPFGFYRIALVVALLLLMV
ncbi:MAG: undecaprenyl-diphosphate phosphatase [bacterium]|nr:undecaprenyl-diphosphate phosphatase [bacterium]